MKGKSIKFKLILVTIIMFVAMAVVVSLISSVAVYRSTMSSVEATFTETVQIAASNVEKQISIFNTALNETAINEHITNPKATEKDIVEYLATKTEMYKDQKCQFFFADANARVYGTELDVADRDFYMQAMQGNAFLSDPIARKDTGKLSFSFAVPAKRNNQIAGVVYILFDYSSLYNIVTETTIGETGGAYVVNKSGETIIYNDEQLVMDHYNTSKEAVSDSALQPLADMETAALRGENGFSDYSYGGQNKVGAYAPIPNTNGWAFLVTAERAEFTKLLGPSIIVIIIGCTLIALLSIVFMSICAAKIAKPVGICAKRLSLLASGDLTTPVEETKETDETGLLINSLHTTIESLKRVINDITTQLDNIARGDISSDIDMQYKGSFASIGDSFRKISSALNESMYNINQVSTQVASGSGQVSAGAQALSQGATEQAAAVEELAATITDISKQVHDTAGNASHAREQTDQAGREMESCKEQMEQMISAMSQISQKSNEIGKIIKTIEDIAFQTNILALNAAVEAARAGVAGKGFAVVADEVRNLASKSAQASKNTSELIEASIKAVAEGTSIADATAMALLKVVEGTKNVTTIVDKIALAAETQATSIAQVTQGVDQISSVVQTNSATAEESAASSEELSSQAESLKNLVSRFKLNEKIHMQVKQLG